MGIRTEEGMELVSRSSNGVASHFADERIRVHGKLFARGEERMRYRGLTYGPFAPIGDGQPFPSQKRVTR